MPVTKLFVEGDLDVQLLNPILDGSPVLQKGGSKGALRPQARREIDKDRERRKKAGEEPDASHVVAGYLRDRDFDFEPPEELSKPAVDKDIEGCPFGWRWCRHEIENYLIEPSLISEARGWPIAEIEDAIRDVAKNIRSYEAARWTVGSVRCVLPPHYELNTRPDELKKEIELPLLLDSTVVKQWAFSSIGSYRDRFTSITDTSLVEQTFGTFIARFDDDFTEDVQNVLLWFSGKDILAGLAEWLKKKGFANPGQLRVSLRDWVIAHPEQTLELLPEWKSLIAVLRA